MAGGRKVLMSKILRGSVGSQWDFLYCAYKWNQIATRTKLCLNLLVNCKQRRYRVPYFDFVSFLNKNFGNLWFFMQFS